MSHQATANISDSYPSQEICPGILRVGGEEGAWKLRGDVRVILRLLGKETTESILAALRAANSLISHIHGLVMLQELPDGSVAHQRDFRIMFWALWGTMKEAKGAVEGLINDTTLNELAKVDEPIRDLLKTLGEFRGRWHAKLATFARNDVAFHFNTSPVLKLIRDGLDHLHEHREDILVGDSNNLMDIWSPLADAVVFAGCEHTLEELHSFVELTTGDEGRLSLRIMELAERALLVRGRQKT